MNNILLLKKIGDVVICYILDDESQCVGLSVYPHEYENKAQGKYKIYPLAEAKIIGDNYSGSYLGGESMKMSDTTLSLKFDRQEERDDSIITYLKSDKGIKIKHTLKYKKGRSYLTLQTELINDSGEDIRVEMLSSFTLGGIEPQGEDAGKYKLHRLRSKWSMEARHVIDDFEDLMLEDSWTMSHYKSVRFGSVGTMPTKNYFPFIAVEDVEMGIMWGAQLEAPSSWQIEVTRADRGVGISGGLADREMGHWVKAIKKGESFTAPEGYISAVKGDIDDLCARLSEAREDKLSIPEGEEALPIIFNEYCTTWGNPSHENIEGILNVIDGKGIDYFVVDCGWFKEDGVRWDISMGDYEPSKTLFPGGIKHTADMIKSHGMKAGIWFEIENVGRMSKAYKMENRLLKRDGITLTTQNRRFWNMNDSWVKSHLKEKIIRFMQNMGFEYIKVDHNETMGIGVDNTDSLGEGMRQNQEAAKEFWREMKREIPNLIIENCASGGGRLEPSFMALCSMASFSDAHECVEIPIIAANLHRAILPRQSQIWCVIRERDSVKRIAYSVAATFLGRFCLSGDVTNLTADQWNMIDRGIAFYKEIAPVIKKGKSKIYRQGVKSYRHPQGAQWVVRENEDYILCVIHTFEKAPKEIKIEVGDCEILNTYSHKDIEPRLKDGTLTVNFDEDFCGAALLLKKN